MATWHKIKPLAHKLGIDRDLRLKKD
ncbi:uncharacterized protein G2W53_033448 [Senna tora]|uniref:Uncharacterized protein n=1 Tax=Senna tora TaxID=362788 RepID=A0A834T042_9FABA|nr:uncharacterized protein G2W53_033448 [Senna tora]